MLFRNPARVIEARVPAEVRQSLVTADQALAEGFWVAGYVAFEAGYAFEPSLTNLYRPLPDGAPLLWLGCYQPPEIGDDAGPIDIATSIAPGWQLRYSLAAGEYGSKVERIRDLISAGETYQANLTMDVRWSTGEHPAVMYERLLQAQPVRYAAFLHPTPGWHILSLSPELFFSREGAHISMRPMKGTASPGLDAAEARANSAWLRGSEKNRAENLMIVDMLRNDLGRICKLGSIQVTQLFDVEKYPTVLQMTSTIEGHLRDDVGYSEIFGALFPPGSIVGAPKTHTMRLLNGLEDRPRGVYTGAIGYMAPGGVAEFNVAIRTISLRAGKACLGVGAGIVYDSDPVLEYQECGIKSSFLLHQPGQDFQLIETLLLEGGSYLLLNEHIERMEQSAEYFDIAFDAARVRAVLREAAGTCASAHRTRVRLLLDHRGVATWTTASLDPDQNTVPALLLRQERTDPTDRFLRHKTTCRALYDNALSEARRQGYVDALFRNSREEITECAVHNVIISIDGSWLTPPLQSGLLPGLYRHSMLQEGRISEQVLTLNNLLQAESVYVCNAVRGLQRVARIDEKGSTGIAPTSIWTDSKPQSRCLDRLQE